MNRVAAKFVPRLLTEDQRERRVAVCQKLVDRAKEDDNFTNCIITDRNIYIYISLDKMDNADILSYTGETNGQKGVGFIVKKHWKPNIQEIIGISERIVVLIILINGLKITIIQVYAPTESSSDQEIEEFYDLLDDTLNT
jgi:hypothetical protein